MHRTIATTINGRREEITVEPHRTLLELLRDELKLKGAVEGCSVGVCGSCTTLASNIEDKEITPIEGHMQNGELDVVQQAFLKHQAFQCGFCTTGMIMAVKGLLNAHAHPSEEQARDFLSGNLCRCGTYKEVLAAVKELSDL